MAGKFLYFAYGSNLLAQRLHINNPSAVRKAIGKLQNYRLDFQGPAYKTWGGCPCTIVEDNANFVWGAVWEIDNSDLPGLDRQEGVHAGIYERIKVNVQSPTGEEYDCQCYKMVSVPERLKEGEILPLERRPSPIYMKIIIKGARESALPSDYISFLEKIPNNGYTGPIGVNIKIDD